MRKRICWLLFLFIWIKSSQGQGNLPDGGNFTITVLVRNPMSKEITVEINPISLVSRPARPDQKKMPLDDKNKGVLKIPLKGPSVIKLMNLCRDSSVSYIAVPGTDLIIHIDALGNDTIHYNDSGPKETDFYSNILTRSNELLASIPQQDPELFLEKWGQEFDAMQELVTAASASGMSTGYTSWISKSIQSLFQSKLCRQLVTYVTMTRRWPSNMEEYINKVSSITTVQFNQPAFFSRETDKELVESYYQFFSVIQDWKKKLRAPDAETTYRNAINYAKKINAESSRDIMLRYLVTSSTAHTTDTGLLNWMKNAVGGDRQNNYLVKMIAEKQNLLRELSKGKQAPYFEALDHAGNKFSYRNYEGKYLFIDIWATWCVPCRKEIPYLEELKKKYAGQSVEFISVSTDANVNAWKKFVESIENTDQFHSMPGKTSGVKEVYHAALIPAFVLIDPQGKIINPSCFRPSDPELGFLLDELLQKNNTRIIQ